jgi:arylsulfatase A-like enzyme
VIKSNLAALITRLAPILAIVLLAPPLSGVSQLSPPDYNVILITIDTLRASNLSIYGYNKETSPGIENLAREGILFLRSYAPSPSTGPSIASLMTSKYPSFHGMLSNITYFPQENLTLAEVLKKHNYTTAAFVGNYMLRGKIGLNKGFQTYDDSCPEQEKVRRHPEKIASTLTQSALEWLQKNGEQKFFLWLHYQDPHGPYTPPYPYNEKFGRESYKAEQEVPLLKNWDNTGWGGIPWYQTLAGERDARYYLSQYDGEIAFADAQIRKLLDQVKRLDLDKKTIVVLTADHGEALVDDHGYYFSHEHGLTEDQIRIPLILKYPGCPQSKQIQREVSLVDIMPTLLDMLGIHGPRGIQGQDLLLDRQEIIFAEHHLARDDYAVRMGRYKFIHRGEEKLFYNVEADPDESRNLFPQNSGVSRELDTLLATYMQKANQAKIQKTPYKPTPEEIQKLKSLGYISQH